MPLFVFAAGYFYNEILSAFKYIRKRFLRLVIPFYGWNLFYGILVTILVILGVSNIGNTITFENFFINPWTTGDSYYQLNFASWFLIWLFTVQVAYVLIRKILLRAFKNEYFLFVICLIAGLIGTYLSTIGFTSEFLGATLIKLLFGLPFIQLGYLYRVKLEKHDKPTIKSFAIVCLIQFFLISFMLSSFPFDFVVAGGQFKNVVLPFITSLTGIWFCLQISSFLSQKIGSNRIISFFGNHTSDIMIHHSFGFWVLNSLFFLFAVPNFSVTDYRTNIFYEYYLLGDGHFLILYVFAAILVPLGMLALQSFIKKKLGNLFLGFKRLIMKMHTATDKP